MAANDDRRLLDSDLQDFKHYTTKLMSSVPGDGPAYKSLLNTLLDQFISLDYSYSFVKDQEAALILSKVCTLVPLKYELLVTKACQVIVNIVAHQQVTLEQATLDLLLEYIVTAVRTCQSWTLPDTLRALGAVLYENGARCGKYCRELLSSEPKGILLKFVSSEDADVRRGAIQCIGNMCMRTPDGQCIEIEYLEASYKVIVKALQIPKPSDVDDNSHCRLLLSALRGLQSILLASKTVHLENIGAVLAALKVYTVMGMAGLNMNVQIPAALYPTPMSQYDPNPTSPAKQEKEDISLRPGSGASGKGSKGQGGKQGKKTKKRRSNQKKDKAQQDEEGEETENVTVMSGNLAMQATANVGARGSSKDDSYSFRLTWDKVSSSESEYSDTEGGEVAKIRSSMSKIRQTALGCLHTIIRCTDKRIMFGYWSSFLPDSPSTSSVMPQTQTLFTTILKDPAPKARAGALTVLSSLLDGSKQYLAAADDRDYHRTAFTPFSVTLGSTIKEIHRCLLLALVAETSSITLTQVVKCLAILVLNTPYHKLRGGLLTKMTRHIKTFLSHKDHNVRVACLTFLGSIVCIQPQLEEVVQILQPVDSANIGKTNSRTDLTSSGSDTSIRAAKSDGQRDTAETQPKLNPKSQSTGQDENPDEGSEVSQKAESASTDKTQRPQGSREMSWVIKLCTTLIHPSKLGSEVQLDRSLSSSVGLGKSWLTAGVPSEPLPVRLEALQVMTQLVKGYFSIVRGCLSHMCDVIYDCLEEKDPSVQLHSSKLLEELGKAMLQQLQQDMAAENKVDRLTAKEVVTIWNKLLGGPAQGLLQNQTQSALRSSMCDCLSNIGAPVFELLPRDKRILCITLLLGLSNDDDYRVKSSAVRALGVFVVYPCLREDVLFVADTANVILNCLEDNSVLVRMKSAWSLGNLSDALVMNKDSGDVAFLEDFSDMLLQRLFTTAIKASEDSDKVKSNGVRAIGNLLRFLKPSTLAKSGFMPLVEQSVQALVKTVKGGTMKVRWNACYAVGNMFKNSDLPVGSAPWTAAVYDALLAVVTDCKNFKVRINAGLALAIPTSREKFGDVSQYCKIWKCLVDALEASEKVTDFSEFKYRENLRDQLCSTLSHLACYVAVDDFQSLSCVIKDRVDKLKEYFDQHHQNVQEATTPDAMKLQVISDAETYLRKMDDSGLSKETDKTLSDLRWIFTVRVQPTQS
ncbi:HEAT repeat-containing protein 6-like isoform X2 [Ptychodera flava]|uniref:HEAT repeat-containing protein 6-like isoform X2 n=1 Tax=Ptychodera flava TaxID=63121 RepID=UPI00396A2939